MDYYNKHYIEIDDSNRVINGWSNGPCRDRDTTGAICINDTGGYQFRITPDGVENPPLFTYDGIPLYMWDGLEVQQRADADIDFDRQMLPKPQPSEIERLKSDNAMLRAQIAATNDRQDFLEDCIAEMAVQVYNT